jgi:hypothetical protein
MVDPQTLIANIKQNILNPIIVLLFALALLYFLHGVYKAVKGSSSEEERRLGQQNIIWGLVGMFIMISAFGLVNLICGTIGCQ